MQKAFKGYTRKILLSIAMNIIKLIKSVNFDSRDYRLHAKGDAFKSRQEIQLLETKVPIEIKTIESTKKEVSKIIPIPSPSYFVIQTNKFNGLEDFYKSIIDISIMTFCIVDKRLESNF